MSVDNGLTVQFYAVQFAGLIQYAEQEGMHPLRVVPLKKKNRNACTLFSLTGKTENDLLLG